MRAMVIRRPGERLRLEEREVPEPGPTQLLIRVLACGVCRTDLHLVDGELPICRYPMVPGHEIVGQVAKMGDRAYGFAVGQRVGVPWLGGACGRCRFCHSGEENLRRSPLHRLPHRWRLSGLRARRPPLLSPHPEQLR